EDSFLLLNHGQAYALEIEGTPPSETLCPFFQPGFVEHVAGCLASPAGRLLDEEEPPARITDFFERLYPNEGRVAGGLPRLGRGVKTGRACGPWLEDRLYGLAAALVGLRDRVREEIEHFPGARPATRAELYRRLHRGRDFLSSCYAEPVTV